jgi:hypothetical protein
MKHLSLLFSVIIVLIFCSPVNAQNPYLDESKITPIKGMVLLCKKEFSTDACNDALLGKYMNSVSIKFVTRDHIRNIMNEKSLGISGLTDAEADNKIGEIVGASHLLAYSIGSDNSEKPKDIFFRFQLINLKTSEIEYSYLQTIPLKQFKKADPIYGLFKYLDTYSEKKLQK